MVQAPPGARGKSGSSGLAAGHAPQTTESARLLSRLRNAARVCRDALVAVLRPSRTYRPAFPTDAEVFAALRSDLPALAPVREAVRTGALAEARCLLVDHLRNRASPRFFVDPAEVGTLVQRFAREHPDWRDHALGVADGWRRYIYADAQGAQSGAGLPDWNHLPLGPGADTVQVHRAHHFAFAVQLARAQAYGAATGPTLKALVGSWLTATAGREESPAYLSPLMAVHRACAITWTLAFLGGANERDAELEFDLLRVLLADARFVHARLGTSVANNHLLGDAFLMVYLGMLYPEFEEAAAWRRDGEPLFLRELERQVYDDGTSFEHSVHYHEFVCEMVTGIVLLARRNGVALPPWVLERHRRMLEFQAALGGPEARAEPIGDAVEHHLFPLDAFDGVGAASHREILLALYDSGFPASTSQAPGLERGAWLLGGAHAASGAARRDAGPFEYPKGGFVVFPDAALDGCLTFRTGPTPDLPCNSGHMHADLLSVYLRLRGRPLIVEAGTYTYRSEKHRWSEHEPEWRAHFLGPSAHNGLCIAGHDPLGRKPGDFPWGELKSRVQARRLASGAGLSWAEATVTGDTPYAGHARGVVHVEGEYWLVYDRLPPSALSGKAWLSLQFAAGCDLRAEGDRSVVATVGDVRLQVTTSKAARELQVVTGERMPPAGWVSARYGEIEAAPTIRIPTTDGPAMLTTLVEPTTGDARGVEVETETTDGRAIGVRVSCGNRTDYVIVPRVEADGPVVLFGVEFRGAALWLRTEGGRPIEARALGGYQVRSAALGLKCEIEPAARAKGYRWSRPST
jgi:hypothetical protein